MDLISVIVPIYNIDKYVRQCIESILCQTYTNLEIILVDDGATDSSPEICDEYALKDERVKVIHKKNGGLSDARNVGLEIARGTYIAFVDGDDWIEPDMYDNLYRNITKHKANVAFGVTEREVRKTYDNEPDGEVYVLEGKEILNAYILGAYKPHILKAAWDKLYTRAIVGNTRFKVGFHGEDGPFNTIIMSRCTKVVFVAKITNHYRDERPGSISSLGISERLFTDRIPIALEQIQVLKDSQRGDLANRQQCVFYDELLRYYILIYRSKISEKSDYLKRIKKIMIKDREQVKKTYHYLYDNRTYKIRMKIFLISDRWYCLIMNCRKRQEK